MHGHERGTENPHGNPSAINPSPRNKPRLTTELRVKKKEDEDSPLALTEQEKEKEEDSDDVPEGVG